MTGNEKKKVVNDILFMQCTILSNLNLTLEGSQEI